MNFSTTFSSSFSTPLSLLGYAQASSPIRGGGGYVCYSHTEYKFIGRASCKRSFHLLSYFSQHISQTFFGFAEPKNAITESFFKLAEPSSKLTEPSNKLTEPSNKLTGSSNKLTGPSNKLIEPSSKSMESFNKPTEPFSKLTEWSNKSARSPK